MKMSIVRAGTTGSAALVCAAVVSSLLVAPASADATAGFDPQSRRDHDRQLVPDTGDSQSLIASSDATGASGSPLGGHPKSSVLDVTWPTNGSATIAVKRPADRQHATPARAGADATEPEVSVVAASVATRAHVKGVVLRVTDAEAQSGDKVDVSVDYSKFKGAFGGGWGSRLRLVSLPACSLTTPELKSCQTQTPVAGVNDAATNTVVATAATLSTGVMALTAAPSGGSGDWSATPLSSSAKWDVSAQTGAFTWSYPMRVPPSASGLEPELALSYSSASVDGRVASTNNQSSWVGDGWDLWSGYIERKYVACQDDMDGDANNASHKTGDLCWSDDNATLVFHGSALDLVKDGASETWRPKADDGTRIEHFTPGATQAWNDDNDGEYWVVTTTDGTQYYFGRGKTSAGGDQLHSAWTVPVFGNNAGEPCNDTAFAKSSCRQAWRWNLDYVVDTHDNSMTYRYGVETNNYGLNNNDSVSSYDRGGYLTRIDYGQRKGSDTGTGPEEVVFTTAERCVTTSTVDCDPADLTESTASSWPDVPFDLICTSQSTCPDVLAPAFFTRKRLATVETKTKISGTLQSVDSWTLTHTLPDPGDGTDAVLWLASITHNGLVGGTAKLPTVTFGGTQKANRVDKVGDAGPPMIRYRLSSIVSESGGITSINYTGEDCEPGDLPASPQSNTRRCFPVQWTPQGRTDPITEYFHKYLVSGVVQDPRDNANGSLPVETSYEYIGDAAWHYDDNSMLPAKRRTWSDFRGYATVNVRTGTPSSTQSLTQYSYFRGMDGDHLPGGDARNVMVGSTHDYDSFNGTVNEETTYNGSTTVTSTVRTPWRSSATATGVDGTKAYHSAVALVETHTPLAAGGERVTSTATTYDDTYGTPTQIDDLGDAAASASADDRCTRFEYARNTGKNLIELVKRVETVSVKCSVPPSRPANVISDTRTYYDGKTVFDTEVPDSGLVTGVEQLKLYLGAAPVYIGVGTTYDALGRVTSTTDQLNRVTKTSYSPAGSDPLTSTVVTSPPVGALTFATTTQVNPAWGVPTTTTDPAGRVTAATYDSLGRVTQVWQPDRKQSTDTPTLKYTYTVGAVVGSTVQNAVTTQTLNAAGDGYSTTVQLYDALLRARQTQAPGLNRTTGGRVVTDTIYDSRGLVSEEYGQWATTGTPSVALVTPDVAVPSRTDHVYDGAGRETATIFDVNQQERWRTTTAYGGDRVTVTPPAGGVKQTTVTDARGETTALIEYNGATAQQTNYTYDAAGRMASMTDVAGNKWKNTYDLLGRQTSASDPDKGTTTMVYDDAGQLTSTTDARNQTLTYTYDALGRKTQVSDSTTKLATWVYDTVMPGLLTSSSRWSGANEYKSAVTNYDAAGRPLNNIVTIPQSETGLAGTYKTEYAYTSDGQLKMTKYPALSTVVNGTATPVLNGETVTTYYDAVNKPEWMSGGLGWGAYVAGSTYSTYGEPLGLDLGGGYAQMVNYSYEEGTRRLQRMWLARENINGFALDVTYTYDNAGNVTSALDAAGSKDAQCFTYDGLRRVTEAWTPTSANCATAKSVTALSGAAPYWKSYSYDTIGDRTSEVTHASAGNTTVSYTRPAANPASPPARPHAATSTTTTGVGATSSTYAFDASGNMTTRNRGGKTAQTLTWNTEGQLATLVEGSTTSNYLYDADGNRLIRKQGSVKTLYLPGQELTWTSATTAGTAVRYYTFAGQTVASRTTSSADTAMSLVSDAQGTATIAVASKTNTLKQRYFDPFGNSRDKTAATWQGDHGFLGKPTDSSTLTQVGARYYDGSIGAFVSVDPIMDLNDPQQWNGYAYSNNNPTTWSDPTGLEFEGSAELTAASEDLVSQGYTPSGVSPKKSEPTVKTVIKTVVNVQVGSARAAWDFATGVGHSMDPMYVLNQQLTKMWQFPGLVKNNGWLAALNIDFNPIYPFVGIVSNGVDAIRSGDAEGASYNFSLIADTIAAAVVLHEVPAATAVEAPAEAAAATTGDAATGKALVPYQTWPDSDGFLGGYSESTTLEPGTALDRYGLDTGSFVSPQGTPFAARGLPLTMQATSPYVRLVVQKPLAARVGLAAPWKDSPGLGVQYKLPDSVEVLKEKGYLGGP